METDIKREIKEEKEKNGRFTFKARYNGKYKAIRTTRIRYKFKIKRYASRT